jgi:hypothetical protein
MEHKEHTNIYIDRKKHESPHKTNGAALYVLGGINPATHDLWREEEGKQDDKLIENNAEEVHLKEWAHFYSAQKTLNPGYGRSY